MPWTVAKYCSSQAVETGEVLFSRDRQERAKFDEIYSSSDISPKCISLLPIRRTMDNQAFFLSNKSVLILKIPAKPHIAESSFQQRVILYGMCFAGEKSLAFLVLFRFRLIDLLCHRKLRKDLLCCNSSCIRFRRQSKSCSS